MLTDERNKTTHPMNDNELSLLFDSFLLLQRASKRLHARYEWLCDNQPDTETEDGADKVVARLQAWADRIAANVGLYVYHQTDCRGAALYVSFFPIPDNDYTHAACIGY
jgi:hypothetical protein